MELVCAVGSLAVWILPGTPWLSMFLNHVISYPTSEVLTFVTCIVCCCRCAVWVVHLSVTSRLVDNYDFSYFFLVLLSLSSFGPTVIFIYWVMNLHYFSICLCLHPYKFMHFYLSDLWGTDHCFKNIRYLCLDFIYNFPCCVLIVFSVSLTRHAWQDREYSNVWRLWYNKLLNFMYPRNQYGKLICT